MNAITNRAGLLHEAIAAVCPIVGVSIGAADNRLTWRIDYAAEATAGQILDAEAVLASFDVETPAYAAPVIALVAQARLVIDGEDIQGIETSVNFSAAMTIDTNVFWIFFAAPQPDDDFIPFAQARGNGSGRVNADVTGAFTDYIEVTTTDAAGAAAVPISLVVSIQRAQ